MFYTTIKFFLSGRTAWTGKLFPDFTAEKDALVVADELEGDLCGRDRNDRESLLPGCESPVSFEITDVPGLRAGSGYHIMRGLIPRLQVFQLMFVSAQIQIYAGLFEDRLEDITHLPGPARMSSCASCM